MKARTVYIGLGSNLGDRVANLREAGQRLGALVKIENASQLYVAAPLGYVRDDAFVNAVIRGMRTFGHSSAISAGNFRQFRPPSVDR